MENEVGLALKKTKKRRKHVAKIVMVSAQATRTLKNCTRSTCMKNLNTQSF
jgi:hypothetical protein